MTTPTGVRKIDDAHALRALAHPLRLELLEALTLHGPLTATTAADLVGESPANCSWHLRQLAKYGLIEEVPGATGRQRPWQRTSQGMEWHETSSDPAFTEAARSLTAVFIDRELALVEVGDEAVEEAGRPRLSTARRPGEHHELARCHLQAEIGEGWRGAGGVA